MKIRFNNGQEFNYLAALQDTEYFDGFNRQILKVELEKGTIGVDELNSLISDENNTKHIKLVNGEITNIYDDFIFKMKVGLEKVFIDYATSDRPEIYEDRIVFVLGRLTYLEKQIKNK